MTKALSCALALALGLAAAACGEDADSDDGSDDGSQDDADGDPADGDPADGDPDDDDDGTMDAGTPDDDMGDEMSDDGSDADAGPDQSTCEPMFSDAGAACNTLESTATAVAIGSVDGAAPVGTGGTITAGRYSLTAASAYDGSALPVGVSIAQDAEICGGIMQVVQVIAATEKHVTTTLAPDGIDPHLTVTCTTGDPDTTVWSSYTAEGDTLTLYSAAGKMSLTYTKQ